MGRARRWGRPGRGAVARLNLSPWQVWSVDVAVAVSLTPGLTSYAMTEQIKSFDHARFGKQIGHLDAHEIAAIRAILSRMVDW